MHICQVNLICDDPDAGKAFYEHLGFAFRRISPPHFRPAYVSTAPDGVAIGLHPADFAEWWFGGPVLPRDGAGVIDLQLATAADVDELVARLRSLGHPVVKEPDDMEWGERYAVVLDPDGHRVGLKAPTSG